MAAAFSMIMAQCAQLNALNAARDAKIVNDAVVAKQSQAMQEQQQDASKTGALWNEAVGAWYYPDGERK